MKEELKNQIDECINKNIDDLKKLKSIFDKDIVEGIIFFSTSMNELEDKIRKIPVQVNKKNCLRCTYGTESKIVKAKCTKKEPTPHVPFEENTWMCYDFCVKSDYDAKKNLNPK